MAKARLAFGLCCLVAAIIAVPQLASAGNRGNFAVNCLYSHTQTDDPIVFPDQPGASHMHDFFGNITTDAFSTPAALLATTSTCKDSLDHSGYWTPQTSMKGVPIVPIKVENYWINTFGDGAVEVPPVGLEFVAGNSHATGEQDITIVHFNCGAGSNPPFMSPYSTKPYDCTSYMSQGSDGVVETINFPTCWDGVLPVGNDTADFALPDPTRGTLSRGVLPSPAPALDPGPHGPGEPSTRTARSGSRWRAAPLLHAARGLHVRLGADRAGLRGRECRTSTSIAV